MFVHQAVVNNKQFIFPYSTLRYKTYECLQTWLEVVGASSGLESVAETLLEQLLVDARPQAEVTKVIIDFGQENIVYVIGPGTCLIKLEAFAVHALKVCAVTGIRYLIEGVIWQRFPQVVGHVKQREYSTA